MKNNWKWFLGVAVVLLVLVALPFVFRSFGYGMMGGGWHRPMMGGYGFMPFGGFPMGFGMASMWVVPIGLILLAVYGVTRFASQPNAAALPKKACPHCDKSVQEEWKNCPYCGSEL